MTGAPELLETRSTHSGRRSSRRPPHSLECRPGSARAKWLTPLVRHHFDARRRKRVVDREHARADDGSIGAGTRMHDRQVLGGQGYRATHRDH